MTDQVEVEVLEIEEPQKKGGKGPLLIGVVLSLLLGGASFYGVWSGMLPTAEVEALVGLKPAKEEKKAKAKVDDTTAYLSLEPLAITLLHEGRQRQLRLKLSVETDAAHLPEVEKARLRIVDAINTMIRAVEPAELTNPAAMDRLRAQMLHRIRLAAETDAVSDLLIQEYVVI